MVKRHKKIFRIGLLAGLLAALMCFSAAALTEGDWEYSLLGNEVHLEKYIGSGGNVDVPSQISGAPVTKINSACFNEIRNDVNDVTSVHIPGTVKEIEHNAFLGAESIRSISIDPGVVKIGSDAFNGDTSLEKINLPDTVTEIGDHLFRGCTNLTSVTLSKELKEIPMGTFMDCESLRQVELPPTLEIIDTTAFARAGLTEIKIPASVTVIHLQAFSNCDALQKVEFQGAKLTDIGQLCFSGCSSLEELYLPVSLKEIGGNAFKDCSSLTGMILPYGLNKVGNAIFSGCTGLEWVSAPSTLTSFFVSNFIGDQDDAVMVYCPAGSKAEESCQKAEISYKVDASADSKIQVVYNGERISFAEYGQNPVLDNSRTLVPLRSIFEAMGASVEWDNDTQTAIASRGSTTVKITIGQNTLYKNGQAVSLDVPAKLIGGRTMVPVRAIAEAFNAEVGWVNAAQIVTINE